MSNLCRERITNTVIEITSGISLAVGLVLSSFLTCKYFWEMSLCMLLSNIKLLFFHVMITLM